VNIDYKEMFLNHLKLLHQTVEKVEGNTINESALINARLFDDMLPFNVQVKIATNFALRACCPIVGVAYQELEGDIESFSGLKNYVTDAIVHINTLSKASAKQLALNIEDTAGFKNISMPSTDYVCSFVLPNFFFHISMVYAIAKCHGVPMTKGDIDGIHEYPENFSWET
jgi:hypothetical protein